MPDGVLTFNSPIETGVRALILLAEAYPQGFDLQRILEYDYMMVHTGDFENGPPSIHPALPLRSGELLVRRALIDRGLMLMVSRAYHDSLFISRIAPAAMLFIPCRKGYSHRPDEYASPEDIVRGTLVLAETLAALSA